MLVVDGSIPLKDNGIYCMVAGEPIVDHIRKAAEGAAAIIAIGSCSAWGGVAAAGVNPTGAVSLQEVLPGKTVINIPGCPPNPHNFLTTQFTHRHHADTGNQPNHAAEQTNSARRDVAAFFSVDVRFL